MKIYDLLAKSGAGDRHNVHTRHKTFSGSLNEIPDGVYTLGPYTIIVAYKRVVACLMLGSFCDVMLDDRELKGQWTCMHHGAHKLMALELVLNHNGCDDKDHS